MRRNKVLLFSLLLILVILGGVTLVAAQDSTPEASCSAPTADLVMWSSDGADNDAIYQDLFTQWAAMCSPDSTLTIQSLETEAERQQILNAGLSGSDLPDLILGPNDPIGVYVNAGLLQPLDDLFDMSVYNSTLAAAQLGGVTYGVPLDSGNHLMLMYNKSMVSDAPATWDDLIALAHTFDDNPDVQGFAYNLNEPFWFLPFVHGFGGTSFDADGNLTLDTQPWIDAYQFVHDLKFVDKVVPSECDYNCADGLFKTGGAAMILNGDWAIGDYLDTEKSPALGADNLGLAPWPLLPDGGRPAPFTAGKFLSIPVTVTGDQLTTTVALATWLTTDTDAIKAHAIGTGRLPALTSAYSLPEVADNPLLAASAAALATGVGMPANVELRCMWDSVRPSLEGVMSDAMTPADAAAEQQTAGQDCVAQMQ